MEEVKIIEPYHIARSTGLLCVVIYFFFLFATQIFKTISNFNKIELIIILFYFILFAISLIAFLYKILIDKIKRIKLFDNSIIISYINSFRYKKIQLPNELIETTVFEINTEEWTGGTLYKIKLVFNLKDGRIVYIKHRTESDLIIKKVFSIANKLPSFTFVINDTNTTKEKINQLAECLINK